MFVFDGAKARLVALVIVLAAAIPFFPKVQAVERPRPAAAEESAAKVPGTTKKTKKKVPAHHVRSIHSWAFHRHPGRIGVSYPHEPRAKEIKIVLAAARAQLGKPYRWAGTGPRTFDCSGLTMYVWKKAGVQLPHNSSAQYSATKHVRLKKARPGDIVFMPHHVGIYIGKGRMIHAPHSGDLVQVAPVQHNAYGAGRPLVR